MSTRKTSLAAAAAAAARGESSSTPTLTTEATRTAATTTGPTATTDTATAATIADGATKSSESPPSKTAVAALNESHNAITEETKIQTAPADDSDCATAASACSVDGNEQDDETQLVDDENHTQSKPLSATAGGTGGNEAPKRITRNSPLPTALVAGDGACGNSSATQCLAKKESNTESGGEAAIVGESDDGSNNNNKMARTCVNIRGRKSLKESKEAAAQAASREDAEKAESSDHSSPEKIKSEIEHECKDAGNAKEECNRRGGVKEKDKLEKDSTTVATLPLVAAASANTSNRITRKSVVLPASTTRITRNRQIGSNSNTIGRPDTPTNATPPPTLRGRRAAASKKMPMPIVEPASSNKRKRSEEESGDVALGCKYIKVEAKDESEVSVTGAEDELPPPEFVKIKQEIVESDAESVTDTPPASATAGVANIGRGRGRWGSRNRAQATTPVPVSPSTRSTRHSKVASPSPSSSSTSSVTGGSSAITATGGSESKRRRVGSATSATGSSSTVTRSSSLNLLKTNAITTAHPPDEDSKDSMASSMDDLLLTTSDIKMEKLTPDMEDPAAIDYDIEAKAQDATTSETSEEKCTDVDLAAEAASAATGSNGVAEPLTVETTDDDMAMVAADEVMTAHDDTMATRTPVVVVTSTAASSSSTAGSDKAASLSPELVSEGISEISVQQFYKKPEFLENNLGIEEDPKLGEIVQKVSATDAAANEGKEHATNATTTTTTTASSCSSSQQCVEAEKIAAVKTEIKTETGKNDSDGGDTSDEGGEVETDEIKDNKMDDALSNCSLKEGELRFDDSGDDKKSTEEDDAISLHAGTFSPLILEDDDENDKVADDDARDGGVVNNDGDNVECGGDGNSLMLDEVGNDDEIVEEIVPADDAISKSENEHDDELDEDDATAEESETISMDNNASLQDDAPDERDVEEDVDDNAERDEAEEKITEVLKVEMEEEDGSKEDLQELSNDNIVAAKEKTTNECDNAKAKLNTEIEQDQQKQLDNKQEKPKSKKRDTKDNNDVAVKTAIIDDAKKNTVVDLLATSAVDVKDIKCEVEGEGESDVARGDKTVNKSENRLTKDENKENVAIAIATEAMVVDDNDVDASESDIAMTATDDENCLVIAEDTDSMMDIGEEKTSDILKVEDSLSDEKTSSTDAAAAAPIADGSPSKLPNSGKDDDVNSIKSEHSTDINSWLSLDTNHDEETLRQKEQHLQNLGLLTHKAAERRRLEYIQSSAAAVEASRVSNQQQQPQAQPTSGKRNGKGNSNANVGAAAAAAAIAPTHEYTGTLKTVIKLNRSSSSNNSTAATTTAGNTSNGAGGGGGNSNGASNGTTGRKSHQHHHPNGNKDVTTAASGGGHNSSSSNMRRQSLKMTFQKGRGRHNNTSNADRAADPQTHGEEAYYTIQNENEGAQKATNSSSTSSCNIGSVVGSCAEQRNAANVTAAAANTAVTTTTTTTTHGRKAYNRSNTTTNSNNNNNKNSNINNNTNNNNNNNSSGSSKASAANTAANCLDSLHSESSGGSSNHLHDIATGGGVAATIGASVHIHNHKKDEKEEILIPEKASSFKFHPGRLCEDQCFYCSGKFGLYDTPCHVGQIKSLERQQKILANEEKLTVDNCLCDACFRHVDRRANAPSYKKRLSAPSHLEHVAANDGASNSSSGNADAGTTDAAACNDAADAGAATADAENATRKCLVPECANPAAHSLRRKCIRKSVKKFLLNFDVPTSSAYIWLCQAHYDTVIQCSGCVLCKRRLGKNHMYHITSDTDRLEKALSEMGIPVQLGIGTAVCKLCRYFANLLMKPPDSTKSQKAEFVKNYRKRLLQFHNIHDGSNDASEAEEEDTNNASSTSAAAAAVAADKLQKSMQKISGSKAAQQRRGGAEKLLLQRNGATGAANRQEMQSPTDSSSSVECLGIADSKDSPPIVGVGLAASGANAAAADDSSNDQQQQQMVLENDVLVDYDVPMVCTDSNSSSTPSSPKPPVSKLKAILQSSNSGGNASTSTAGAASDGVGDNAGNPSDISNVLRANPNISMRELFPGEEDLGLQFKAPFGSINSQRTPEGWTRVQTFLQYDEPTRRLWEELQKPYGNQSSFLRHLILLEKYYRNGDLVLSPHASSNASVYTQTVRQRLTSYDHGHCGGLVANPKPGGASATADMRMQVDEESAPATPAAMGGVGGGSSSDGGGEHRHDTSVENISSRLSTSVGGSVGGSGGSTSLSMQLRSRSVSVDKLTKQLSTNAVTIIARPKEATKLAHADASTQKSLLKEALNTNGGSGGNSSSSNSPVAAAGASSNRRSILKANLLGMNKAVEILPLSAATTVTATSNTANAAKSVLSTSLAPASSHANAMGNVAQHTSTTTDTKQQKILEVANKLLGNQMEQQAAAAIASSSSGSAHVISKQSSSAGSSLLTSPPELVSLQRRSSTSATTSGHVPAQTPANNSNGNSGHSSSNNASAGAVGGGGSSGNSLLATKRLQPPLKGGGSSSSSSNNSSNRNVLKLPDTLTPQERLQSRSWRPTLLPVDDVLNLSKNGPLYQTADGRRLPAMVQVQSGGKPFLISIFDYNRMCILRREKLLRDQMLKNNRDRQEQRQQHQQQAHQQQSQHHSSQHQLQQAQKNAAVQNYNKNMQKHQQQQQQHQQKLTQQQQHHAAQQQLMQLQLMQLQKHQQQAALKAAATSAARYQPIAPKPNAASGIATSMSSLSGPGAANAVGTSSSFSASMVPQLTASMNCNAPGGAVANAAKSSVALNNNPWLWNNFPDANQLLLNGAHTSTAAATAAAVAGAKLLLPKMGGGIGGGSPMATMTSKQQQQFLESTQIMSKIPKSLTVIPPHKLMAAAATALAGSVNAPGGGGDGGGSVHKE